ncbi:MAG: nucleoside deaminase [Pseudomonadota bacterium]|nr:nucleoside deaminase [Pseudomonadota bacterium]
MNNINYFMEQALKLAVDNIQTGAGGPFGAVIVKANQIIAQGQNQVIANHDPTAHAEMVAIRQACAVLGQFQLENCVVYSSCEPCPMCLGALYWARVAKVYYANTRHQAAAIGFDDAFIYEQIIQAPLKRSIPFIHIPLHQAQLVFEQWQAKADKTLY